MPTSAMGSALPIQVTWPPAAVTATACGRGGDADGLDGPVDAVSVGPLAYDGGHVVATGNKCPRAEGPGVLELRLGRVDHEEGLHVEGRQAGQGHEADGAAADDGDRARGRRGAAPDGVEPDGQRFRQGGHLQRGSVGDGEHAIFGHDDPFGIAAGHAVRHAVEGAPLAHVRAARSAEVARTAVGQGLHGDAVADRAGPHVRPDLRDDAGGFVAHDRARAAAGRGLEHGVQVRAADAGRHDVDPHVPRSQGDVGPFLDPQIHRAVVDKRSQGETLLIPG